MTDRELIDKAIAKITEEAMKMNDPFAFFIEEHLTERCSSKVEAEKILADGKSIEKIANKIRGKMEKQAREANPGKRSAWWGAPDAELLQMVDKYYGIGVSGALAEAQAQKPEPADRLNVLDLF